MSFELKALTQNSKFKTQNLFSDSYAKRSALLSKMSGGESVGAGVVCALRNAVDAGD